MPAFNFGELTNIGFNRARQWLRNGYGQYLNGKPPIDNSSDNNYQYWSDNAAGTGALPTFKECNTNNQFEITNGETIMDNSLVLNAVAVPATPTAVVNGTAGSTSNTYVVVGRAGGLQAPSASVTPTTCNATLSAANSVTLTFVPTAGFHVYDIYRTVSGGTPSTTGRIGSVPVAFGSNVSSPTLSFTDTGLVGDGSTAPTANTTGGITGDLNVFGNINLNALATPAAPIATVNGTAGTTTITYKIVARSGSLTTSTGHTAASAGVTVTTANATLSSTNSITLVWQPVVGTVGYDVYRTATNGTAPTTTGKIGSTVSPNGFTDTGLAGDSSTAPTANTTGIFSDSGSGDTTQLAAITDVNGNPEIIFTATASAVNGLTETNAATGNAVKLASSGSDTNIPLVLGTKGSGYVELLPGTASGKIGLGPAAAVTTYQSLNYIATETGSNNAIAGALTDAAGNNITQAAGLRLSILLAHTLQAGANTFALNGASAASIVSHRNPASNLGTAYASGGIIDLMFDGTHYQDMSE